MSKFTLEIETENAAFADDRQAEIARILHYLATAIDFGVATDGIVRDSNGNTVGSYTNTVDGD